MNLEESLKKKMNESKKTLFGWKPNQRQCGQVLEKAERKNIRSNYRSKQVSVT